MRHGDKIKNLSRTASHRRALLSNLASQLIEHKRIVTTVTKAKSLRVYVEPMLTRAKNDNTHNRRVVFSYLQNKDSIKELFGTIGDKIAQRPGGYTRIIKLPRRTGDAAEMAMIELVDFNEIYHLDQSKDTKKTRRSRRSSSSKKEESGSTVPVGETEAAPATDAPEAVVETETPQAAADTEAPEAPVQENKDEAKDEEGKS